MKKIFYQICAAFIRNKEKRKAFRQKYIGPFKKISISNYDSIINTVRSMNIPQIDYNMINHLIQLNLSTALLHQKTFLPFKNKHQGQDIVIVATGPSARKYKPIPNTIHIGVNRAIDVGVDLDYLFIQDYSGSKEYLSRLDDYRKGKCIKFYGLTTEYDPEWDRVIPESNTIAAKALRYRTDWVKIPGFTPKFSHDISSEPLGCFGSIVFPALQFALWTNPKRIYLVGCDCTSGVGYFDKQETGGNSLTDTIVDIYKSFKGFAHIYYPNTEIISINPVGLKGIFIDKFQEKKLEKKKEILLINDTDDNYHYGCSATSTVIKNKILEKCENIRTIPVDEIWNAKNPPQNLNDFNSGEFRVKYIAENSKLVDEIIRSDKIVVNGEGTILGWENRSGTQNLLYLIHIAQYFEKPISIINHSCFPTMTPYEDSSAMPIYEKVYKNLEFCVVRDIRSLAILKKLGCANVTLGFDCLPLYIENYFKAIKTKYTPQSYICISGGIYFQSAFKEFLDIYVKKLYEKYHKKIVFLMSNTKIKSLDDLGCLDMINEFNSKSSIKVETFYANNTDEFLSFIKNSFFQITGRFHHSIAASYLNVPFLVYVTHSPKNEIFNDLIPGRMIYTLNGIIDAMEGVLQRPTELNKSSILKLCNENFSFLN